MYRSQADFQVHLTNACPHYTFQEKEKGKKKREGKQLVPRKPHKIKGQETEGVD